MRLFKYAPFLVVAICGCTKYTTYTECVLVEEQKGASHEAAAGYCLKLADQKKIECDGTECKLIQRFDRLLNNK